MTRNKALLGLKVIAVSIALSAVDGLGDDQKSPPQEVKSPWSSDDERIFILMKDRDPLLLKLYIDILAGSKQPEKRMLALEALAYDRMFHDATEIFGKNYRVNHLIKLVVDERVEVRRLARDVLDHITSAEIVEMVGRLQAIVDQSGATEERAGELKSAIEHMKQRLLDISSGKLKG